MAINLGKCRLCLKLGNFYSIFTKDNNVELADMVMDCARVKIYVGDGLPDKICSECIQKLSSAHIFKQQCERSDQELRQHYASRNTFRSSLLSNSHNIPEINNSSHNSIASTAGNCMSSMSPKLFQKHNSTIISTKSHREPTPKKTKINAAIRKTKMNPVKVNVKAKQTQSERKKISKAKNKRNVYKKIEETQSSIDCSIQSKAQSASLDISETQANAKSSTVIKDTKDNLECNKCNKTFKLNIMLKRHFQTCNKSSRTALHEIEASLQQLVNFSCEICTVKFRTMINLQKHMKAVHKVILKQERCSIKEPIKISLPCIFCNIPFTEYPVYCAHFNSCTKRNGISNFVCPLCSRMIMGKSSYFIHIKNFHFEPQEVKSDVDIKPSSFLCCLCNKIMSTSELLKAHLESHQQGSGQNTVTNEEKGTMEEESRRSLPEESVESSSCRNPKLSTQRRNFPLSLKHEAKIKKRLECKDFGSALSEATNVISNHNT